MQAPHNHACPPATTHTPHSLTCPPATMHTPLQPHMPPRPPNDHAHPPQPCMSPATMHAPLATIHAPTPVNRMTNRCENITLPQTSFVGSNKSIISKISMHSSRMRTAHLLPVSPSMHCMGGYLLLRRGGLEGCLWSWGCIQHDHPPPPVNRMTDRCKNITLPQTSFAGVNKVVHK